VWPWIVGIVAGIIIVGVAALIAWKCIIYWKVLQLCYTMVTVGVSVTMGYYKDI